MTIQYISSGVTSSGVEVTSGEQLDILSGGVASGLYVDSGGTVYLSAGAMAEALNPPLAEVVVQNGGVISGPGEIVGYLVARFN